MLDALGESIVEAELRANGIYVSTTRGVSMRPLFRTGRDIVILESPKGELLRFDVALYKSRSGAYTLHRVIAVKENEYLIRGDNTYSVEHIAKDRVLAVLTEFRRKGKKYTVNDKGYRIYVRIWCFIYPIRHIIHMPRPLLGKIYRKLFRRK